MQKQYGISLLEITIVVFILGVFALAATPNLSRSDSHKLNLAAEEIAQAIRFARSEAQHKQTSSGFNLQANLKKLRLFNGNSTSISFDVYHPVSKQPYTVDFTNHPFASIKAMNSSTTFQGTCNDNTEIYFDPKGMPWCNDPITVPLRLQSITLSLDSFSVVVTLDGLTGKVTVI